MLPPIKGFIQNSLLDWPGKISCIIFLPGCNFRCPFCHASHLVVRPNELESIPFTGVRQFLMNHIDWVDGVVVSGGEPTTSAGLFELLDEIRRMGFAVRVDTNGSNPEVIEQGVREGLIQSVGMDVKAPLDTRYSNAAGVAVDLEKIRRSIDFLIGGGAEDYEFRTTVVPGMHSEDDIVDIAGSLSGAERYILQNFHPLDCIDPGMMSKESLDPNVLKAMAAKAAPHVKSCWVRGYEEALK